MAERYNPNLSHSRNLREICELFDPILLMKNEKMSSEVAGENFDSRMELSKEGKRLLKESNLVNRIFRYWYQLNWGESSWCEDFEGSTPRQELMTRDEDIRNGRAMLSVDLEWQIYALDSSSEPDSDMELELATVPRYFSRSELESAGGAFLYGLNQLENQKEDVVAPNFDPDFREFAEKIKKEKNFMADLPSFNLHNFSEEILYWRVFVEDAAMAIVKRVQPRLSKEESTEVSMKISSIIIGLASYQKEEESDYILIDELFDYIWQVFREYNPSLFSYEYFVNLGYEEDLEKNTEDEATLNSIACLYLLGYALDKHFLFPADRYFNAVEIVWQDKFLFAESLAMLYQFLNNNMEPPERPEKGSKHDEKAYEELDMGNTGEDPKEAWINPSTCFRFHDWVLESF